MDIQDELTLLIKDKAVKGKKIGGFIYRKNFVATLHVIVYSYNYVLSNDTVIFRHLFMILHL